MTQPSNDVLNALADVAREEHLQLASEDIGGEMFAELSDAEMQRLARTVTERSLQSQPRPSDARARARLQRGFGRPRAWLAAAAVLCTGLWLFTAAPPARQQRDGTAAFRTGTMSTTPESKTDGEERQRTLPDGSRLLVGDHSEARLLVADRNQVRVELVRGSVECDVTHDPDRRFVVAAGGLDVLVKGTRFTVSLAADAAAPERVTVSVERGVVEVRQRGDQQASDRSPSDEQRPEPVLALVAAGQRWSSGEHSPTPLAPAPAMPPAPANQPPARPAASAPPTVLAEAPRAPQSEPASRSGAAPSPHLALVEDRASGSNPYERLVRERPPSESPASRSAARRDGATSAKSLFERADAARLAGQTQQAAAAFDELRRRYPNDPRAGQAAFMLGRIRLDTLGDASGAAEAFTFAVEHPANGYFLEDARARLVEALDKSEQTTACRAARERFLTEHPHSVRAPIVSQLCGYR